MRSRLNRTLFMIAIVLGALNLTRAQALGQDEEGGDYEPGPGGCSPCDNGFLSHSFTYACCDVGSGDWCRNATLFHTGTKGDWCHNNHAPCAAS